MGVRLRVSDLADGERPVSIPVLGARVQGLGFGGEGLRVGGDNSGIMIQGLGYRVQGLRFTV